MDSSAASIHILPGGTGYLRFLSSLLPFDAIPPPAAITTSASQYIEPFASVLTSHSDAIAISSGRSAYLRRPTGASSNNIALSLVAASSSTFDGLGETLFRASCENTAVRVERFSFDTKFSPTNPTHSSRRESIGCSPFAFGPVINGATDPVSKKAVLVTSPSPAVLLFARLFNCSTSSTCNQCSRDSAYCSWCASPTSAGSCVPKTECVAPEIAVGTCPSVSVTTPTEVSAEGTTSVTLAGSGFNLLQQQMGPFGGLYCRVTDTQSSDQEISTSLSKVTVFSDGLARCTVNPILSVETTGTTNLNLTLAFSDGTAVMEPSFYALPVYSCLTTSLCSDCASSSRADCRWCAADSLCIPRLGNSSCPTSFSPIVSYYSVSTTCAVLQSITPSSTPAHFQDEPTAPQSVSITADFPDISAGWSCVFGNGLASTAGTLNFATKTISCPIAELSLPNRDVDVAVQVKLHSNFFGSNSLLLRYYTCDLQPNCSTCLSTTRPYCSWCLSSASCVGMATSSSEGCTQVTAPPSLPQEPAAPSAPAPPPRNNTCPTATPQPASVKYTASGVSVVLSGGPFLSGGTYTCVFGTAPPQSSAAVFINSSAISCTAPTLPAPTGATPTFADIPLSVNITSSKLYLRSTPLRYYTCSGASECGSCSHPLHTDCAWCMVSASCEDTSSGPGSCSSGTPVAPGQCPSVTSVTPTITSYQGGATLALTGDFSVSGEFQCWFSGPANASTSSSIPEAFRIAKSVSTTPGTKQDSTTLTCPAPAITGPGYGYYDVSITYRSGPSIAWAYWPTYAQIYITNCLLMGNCSNCLVGIGSECKWCSADGSCQHESASCLFSRTVTNAQMCPVITDIRPSQSQARSNTVVTIRGSNLRDTLVLPHLRCSMDNINVMGVTQNSSTGDEDVLVCPTHPYPATGKVPFRLLTVAGATGNFARYNDPNTSLPFIFNTYDCLSSLTCDKCMKNANRGICGWCSATRSCTDAASCPKADTWSDNTCPRVTSLSKTAFDHTDVGTSLTISVSGLQLSSNIALGCSFSSPDGTIVYVNATSVSSAESTVRCPIGKSPFPEWSGVSSVQVVHSKYSTGSPSHLEFTSNVGDLPSDTPSSAEYVECTNISRKTDTCGSCIATVQQRGVDSRCGWCVYEGACGISTSCSSGFPLAAFQTSNGDCAEVTDINPKSGPSTGNTQITVIGRGFVQSDRIRCLFGSEVSPTTFVSPTQLTCLTPRSSIKSGSIAVDFSLIMLKASATGNNRAIINERDEEEGHEVTFGLARSRAVSPNDYTVFASPTAPIPFTVNYAAPPKKSNLAWIAAPVILLVLLAVVFIIVLVLLRRRHRQRKLTPPDYMKYAFSANTKLIRTVPAENRAALDEIAVLLAENNYALAHALRKSSTSSDDDLLARSLIYAAYPNSFSLDMLISMIETEVESSKMEGELFRASSLPCKMYSIYAKIIGVQYLWRTLARHIHTLNDAGEAEDSRQTNGSTGSPPSTGHVSMMDLGTLEVDPERLADKLEREVDEAIMSDIAIYQYELLLKTGRIFKRVVESVSNVPRELRVISKRVKTLVHGKYAEHNMDYKGVCAFFFLRFICPAVMTPQVYGVLERSPGETSQRYFVLISKTLQALANDTLPSQKEAYMAKMDEFVVDNRLALQNFVNELCDVQEHAAGGSDTNHVRLDDSGNHNTRDLRLDVPDEIYYSSLSFIHQNYMANRGNIQTTFTNNHEDDFAQRVDEVMNDIPLASASAEEPKPKRNTKKKTPKKEPATSSGA